MTPLILVAARPHRRQALHQAVEAHQMARRIVSACNRMGAGRGLALHWCGECRVIMRRAARDLRRTI